MALKDYVPVMQRVAKLLADNKDKKVLIKTEPNVAWDKEAAYFRAEISIDGEVKAVGHALAPSLGEDKEFEKAETTAVGRALAFMGYEASDAEAAEEEEEEEDKPRKGLGKGLGSKKKTNKKAKDDEAEEEKEESEEEEESEGEENEEESDENEESEEAEEKEDKKPAAAASGSKLGGIMAKYGLKK